MVGSRRHGGMVAALGITLQCCLGIHVPEYGAVRSHISGCGLEATIAKGGSRANDCENLHSFVLGLNREHAPLHQRASLDLRLRGGAVDTNAKVKALNPRLQSMKQAVAWGSKGIAAAFTGLLTTSSVMVAFEFTAHKLHPAAISAAEVPDTLALMVLVGAIVGSVLGSLVLSKLAPSHPSALAFVVAALFTAAQYLNIQAIDHPGWFNLAGICAFIPPYVGTALLTRGGAAKIWSMLKPTAQAINKAVTPVKIAAKVVQPQEHAVDEDHDHDHDAGDAPDMEPRTPRRTRTQATGDADAPPKSTKKASKTPAKTPRKKK